MTPVFLLVTCLLSTAPQPDGAEVLQGRWQDDDRGTWVEFTLDAKGVWTGTAVDARRKEEVGKVVFKDLRLVAAEKQDAGVPAWKP